MCPMDTLNGFQQAGRCPEGVGNMNAPDDQNLVLSYNLTTNFGRKIPPADRDLTRFQRAGKGADQSATGRCYYIIQGGCMRDLDILGLAPVVFGYCAMCTKTNRLRFCRQISEPLKLFLSTLNADS